MRRLSPFRFAHLVLPLLGVIAAFLLLRRHTLFPETTSDPVPLLFSDSELLSAADFSFTFGEGSGRHGYNVVKVRPDDTCQYTFLDPQWRRAEFSLDHQTAVDLRQLLMEVDFFTLKRSYHGGVQDGTQWFVNVTASGKKKGVYCDNYFPSKVERIRHFVEKRIIEKHRLVIDKAAIIQLERKDMESDGP
jgi:hypothetical protein